MSINISDFEKSPHLMPLLVHLYEMHKLYDLAQDEKPRARVEMTKSVAALLEEELSGREQELLSDVLVSLLNQAELDLRCALAEQLSMVDSAPLRLVLHLANDEIPVAAPILRHSKVLSDLDLVYIIKSQSAEYWQEIAARKAMGVQVIDALADTKNMKTAVTLSDNNHIRLTNYAIDIFSDMAKESDALARPLLHRPEIPESVARKLYAHVGRELRDYISTFFGPDTDLGSNEKILESLEVVDDIIIEFADTPHVEFMPTDTMVVMAQKYNQVGMLTVDFMLDTLRRGQIASFIAQFSEYSGMNVEKVHESLSSARPKELVIACRAHGIQKNDFSRIFLLTHKMRSKTRIVNQRDMLGALSYFDKVRPEQAQQLIKTLH